MSTPLSGAAIKPDEPAPCLWLIARRWLLLAAVGLAGGARGAAADEESRRPETVWSDCPRVRLDPEEGVNRLCENAAAGATPVPLFQAMARLWLNRESARANELMRLAYGQLLAGAPEMTPEIADARAKWRMRLWVRAYYLFNHRSGWYPGRLQPDTERLMEKLFWNYAFAKSTLQRADDQYIWFIQGSENHDLMDLSNAMLALQAIAELPAYKDRALRDGRTAREHLAAWRKYYRRYADERVARGLLVECGSPTYGKYSVPELVNMADFADDAVLRRKMTMLLDILWADWAVEQLGGVRGGGKSRVYQGKYAQFGDRDSYRQMADVLTGRGEWTDGRQNHTNYGYVYCLSMTRYRLPEIVRSLMDPRKRGRYVSISRRPANMTGIDRLPDYQPHPCWYVLDPNDTRAVRYTYCTPDYILGSWWVDPHLDDAVVVRPRTANQPAPGYAAIHSQNRWQGVIFATGPNDRVYPQCLAGKEDHNDSRYSVTGHQQIAVQYKNVMIAQANLRRRDIRAMRVYAAESVRKNLSQRSGWHAARVGDAFVGFMGLHPDSGRPCQGQWEEDDRYYRLQDAHAAVVLAADDTTRCADLDCFYGRLANLRLHVRQEVLTVRIPESGKEPTTMRFDLRQRWLPQINGRPVELNPPNVYDSPFMRSLFGSGKVTLRDDCDAYMWNTTDNSIVRVRGRPGRKD